MTTRMFVSYVGREIVVPFLAVSPSEWEYRVFAGVMCGIMWLYAPPIVVFLALFFSILCGLIAYTLARVVREINKRTSP